ncbi:Uncharacterised protein [Vibrio cholerae]|nr:Uncharacterised protein [Vibrio cholerae]
MTETNFGWSVFRRCTDPQSVSSICGELGGKNSNETLMSESSAMFWFNASIWLACVYPILYSL